MQHYPGCLWPARRHRRQRRQRRHGPRTLALCRAAAGSRPASPWTRRRGYRGAALGDARPAASARRRASAPAGRGDGPRLLDRAWWRQGPLLAALPAVAPALRVRSRAGQQQARKKFCLRLFPDGPGETLENVVPFQGTSLISNSPRCEWQGFRRCRLGLLASRQVNRQIAAVYIGNLPEVYVVMHR